MPWLMRTGSSDLPIVPLTPTSGLLELAAKLDSRFSVSGGIDVISLSSTAAIYLSIGDLSGAVTCAVGIEL